MSDASLEKTTITISNSKTAGLFVATGEVLKFDGFLKVYLESADEDAEDEGKGLLPPLASGEKLSLLNIEAAERFTQSPPRYTEASLVKKLEELGIGRPSTYAPTISTIQQREYVVKEDRPGQVRTIRVIRLENGKIKSSAKTENFGFEKAKLFPTDIGTIVTDFLGQYFKDIMNFNFTASVEEEFDLIAEGKVAWTEMIDRFYKPFHALVSNTVETSERARGEREIGVDPVSGEKVIVKIGRFGPVVQIGDASGEKKPRFASILKGQSLETISLEEALKLFELPRKLGEFEGTELIVGVGRFGPYVRHQSAFYSLKKGVDNPLEITTERAIELITEKREQEKNKLIRKFEEQPGLEVLNGRYGPYIAFEGKNYKIPKGTKPQELSLEECRQIIDKAPKKK
jgi:DNA topoisomerase-1